VGLVLGVPMGAVVTQARDTATCRHCVELAALLWWSLKAARVLPGAQRNRLQADAQSMSTSAHGFNGALSSVPRMNTPSSK
jgi:hypothetical protein